MDKKEIKTAKRATRFVIVGIILTIINYILYESLVLLIIKNDNLLWLSSAVSTIITAILAYFFHSKITWKERTPKKSGIYNFFIWNAFLALIISPFFTQLFSYLTPLYEFAYNISSALNLPFSLKLIQTTGAFCLATAIIMVLNFLFYDKLVFNEKHPQKSQAIRSKTQTLKVSIIIPIYNTEKYLKRCLNSIANQTYKNLEIILVNDGSPDNSSKIADGYARKDKRTKVIHQNNQGLSAARNSGLKIATGDFVTFVDSDDEIKPEMIAELLSAIEKTHSDIAICSFRETFPNGKTKSFLKTNEEKTYSTKAALKAMLKEENFNLTATMKLYSKNSLGKIKFPVGKLHEDVGTTYKFIRNAKKIVFIPKDYYIYHHNNHSIISKFNEEKFDLLDLTDEMCDEIEKKYPELKNTANERRIRARFSLLRQIPLNHTKTKDLLSYLRTNKSFVTKNPEATKTDKLALRLALLNPKLFQLAYKLK